VERLEDRRSELLERLPGDPLECEALVSSLAVLTHEPAEERERVEVEYNGFAERFAGWSADLSLLRVRLGDAGGLSDDPRLDALEDEAASLEAELDAIAAYVHGLGARAREAETLAGSALDACVQAGEALERARRALAASAGPAGEIGSELDAAAVKLGHAWDALEKGRERPQTALRLAGEIGVTAAALNERLHELADLPGDLVRDHDEFAARHAETEQALGGVRASFETARQSHPESSWSELVGLTAQAEHELERAERLWPPASDVGAAEQTTALVQLAEDRRDALAALDEAAALVSTIADRLERLEQAALDGRERLLAAEKEIDRAWAELANGRRPDAAAGLLGRATELAREARAQLDRSQPDWLELSELADRSYAIAHRARAGA
jgi:hypothetical protein